MTDDYIRREDAIDAFNRIKNTLKNPETAHYDTLMFYEIEDVLEDVEPADVVPVVRCGQCGYWHDNDGDYGYCYAKDGQGFGHAWRKNDFCSYGERKGIV